MSRANVTLLVFGGSAQAGGITRATDPSWFDAWRSGALRAIATKDLAADELAALDAATTVNVVAGEEVAQVWGTARGLVGQGATVVLDVHAMRFLPAAALPVADAPADLAREIRVVFETSEGRPHAPHALHTRGMKKFGLPDLVVLCTDADVPLLSAALAELAVSLAGGAPLGALHHVKILPDLDGVLVPDEHGLAQLLQLNNEARVLVDASGHDFVGIARKLRAN